MNLYEAKFGGLTRLYGDDYLEKAKSFHVCIIGIGGVGTWLTEALARSGIGKFTLVDMDDICVTNTNRQIHALDTMYGKLKVEAMTDRIKQINSEAQVNIVPLFFNSSNAEKILDHSIDFVADAMDSLLDKSILIAACNAKKIPLLISGGAGGKTDPTKIVLTDLSMANSDRLLKALKKELKINFKISYGANENYGIKCVYSKELPIKPWNICDNLQEAKSGLRIGCANGLGSASFVTGAFGFAMASHIVQQITNKKTK